MSEELILFDNKFDIQKNKVLYYLYQNTKTKKQTDGENFIYYLTELYRLPILKASLDAIITECKKGNANFVLYPQASWDRVAGHCMTTFERQQTGTIESEFTGTGIKKHYEIVIKNFKPSIIMHEITHAIEHIADLDLNAEFRKYFGIDMREKNSRNRMVLNAVEDVMVKQLKNYSIPHAMAEFFARTFELFSMSQEVDGGDKTYVYSYSQIADFFKNTLGWINGTLLPILYKKNDIQISLESAKIIQNLEPYKHKWTNKIHSKFDNVKNESHRWRETIEQENKSKTQFINNVQETFNNVPKEKIKTLDDGTEYVEF